MPHNMLSSFLQGIPNEVVTGPAGPMSGIDLGERVQALNKLLASRKLSIFQQGNQLLYKAAAPEDVRCGS